MNFQFKCCDYENGHPLSPELSPLGCSVGVLLLQPLIVVQRPHSSPRLLECDEVIQIMFPAVRTVASIVVCQTQVSWVL